MVEISVQKLLECLDYRSFAKVGRIETGSQPVFSCVVRVVNVEANCIDPLTLIGFKRRGEREMLRGASASQSDYVILRGAYSLPLCSHPSNLAGGSLGIRSRCKGPAKMLPALHSLTQLVVQAEHRVGGNVRRY